MNHKPNIVFIMADDVGYGDIGCYNPESRIPTPHIDRLAREGVRFTDAHSPSAVCTPTRYGVLTGRYCWRSRLKYSVLFAYEPPLIEPERLTVARLLQEASYHTACIGKWHLGLGYTAREGAPIDFNRPLPWPSRTERSLEERIDFTQPLRGGLGLDCGFNLLRRRVRQLCKERLALVRSHGDHVLAVHLDQWFGPVDHFTGKLWFRAHFSQSPLRLNPQTGVVPDAACVRWTAGGPFQGADAASPAPVARSLPPRAAAALRRRPQQSPQTGQAFGYWEPPKEKA